MNPEVLLTSVNSAMASTGFKVESASCQQAPPPGTNYEIEIIVECMGTSYTLDYQLPAKPESPEHLLAMFARQRMEHFANEAIRHAIPASWRKN